MPATTTPTDLRELLRPRVERGAALLDSVEPYWWKRIEVALDLSDCRRCVLGQVYGEYGNTASFEALWHFFHAEQDDPGNGAMWGFASAFDVPNTNEYWLTLDDLWLEAIEARRQS